MKHTRSSNKMGFTLIELLVVIGIIVVLSVVVVLTLNPDQLLKQSRDSRRLSDLRTLKTAINLFVVDQRSPNLASTTLSYNACYLATAPNAGTSSVRCGVFAGTFSLGNASTTSSTYNNINATGWLPVNLTLLSAGSPISNLPVDPLANNAYYYYAYAANSGLTYELDAANLESTKYQSTAGNDGGDRPTSFESGNDPGLDL